MPGERERADSEASGHVGKMKGRILGVWKPYSPKWYLYTVFAGVIRSENSHLCFDIT